MRIFFNEPFSIFRGKPIKESPMRMTNIEHNTPIPTATAIHYSCFTCELQMFALKAYTSLTNYVSCLNTNHHLLAVFLS